MTETLLPTTVVGSYPQPDWLIDRDKLTHLPPVRIRAQELWRVPEPWLEGAQDDATRLAIHDMERAGIDIITDGEIRRESYSNRFATALSGVDLGNPATVQGRTSGTVVVPRIVGPIRRLHSVEVRDVEFLRANTDRTIKITLPGPFTMSRQAKNEYYQDEEELVMDYAAAVNAEIRDLKAAGADVIQLDEPWLQARAEEARRLALPAIDRALEGIPGPTALHLCFRSEGGRGRRDPTRRAVAAGARRRGSPAGLAGDRPGARRHPRADGAASLLPIGRRPGPT